MTKKISLFIAMFLAAFQSNAQEAQDVLIPNLKTLRDQYTQGVIGNEVDAQGNIIQENVDVWQTYQDKITAWETLIAENEAKVADIENLGVMKYQNGATTNKTNG